MSDPIIEISFKELRKERTARSAETLVAEELERLAAHIRSGEWPIVYDFTKEKLQIGFKINLILSYPWGG